MQPTVHALVYLNADPSLDAVLARVPAAGGGVKCASFRLDRILTAEMTDEEIREEPGRSLEEFLAKARKQVAGRRLTEQ